MKIVIETIPHSQQRYNTAGDYWRDPEGVLQIRISEMAEPKAEILVAVHEMIEQALTEAAGISNEAIDAFDMGNPDLDDPGADPRAPYHRQHEIATAVEMLLCAELGMSWKDHCAAVDAAV